MADDRIFDAPLENPDDDLLETAPYAKKLAEFVLSVTPPFTIGIYGEWGSGKTSLVNFVRHFLDQHHASSTSHEVVFVGFSAWPHKTADTLWRALLLSVGRKLFEAMERDQNGTAPAAETGHHDEERAGLRQRLVDLLRGEALVLDGPQSAEPDPLASYESLAAYLDQSPVRISSGGERRSRLDDEETLAALASTAFTFLGALSPLAAGLRALLGLDKIEASKLVRREANEALRERIDSVDQIRDLFRKLFEKTAGRQHSKRCVCVFIDDLDRVMPDVALDVLEAIKVFLDEVPSVFLVAADEHLIGQGLRLRFRDLFETVPEDGTMRDLLLRKGQEYFEKIIQLGIRVPPRTAEQTHRFIAAQFPEWLPATDIIRTAIGDNPRRLKQYCNLLRYKYLVAQLQLAQEEPHPQLRLFEKILTVHAWSPRCSELVRDAALDPASYRATLEQIEACLRESKEDHPVSDARTRLPGEAEWELFSLTVAFAPLFRLFQEQPLLSSQEPATVETLVGFADITPHPEEILRTSDRCFLRILEIAARRDLVPAQKLLQDDLVRLAGAHRVSPRLLDLMEVAAENEGWSRQMYEVEKLVESGDLDPKEDHGLQEAFTHMLAEIRAAGSSPETNEAVRLLMAWPRFSALLPEEILAFREVRPHLPSARTLPSSQLTQGPFEVETDRLMAAWALPQVSKNLRTAAEEGLKLRLVAARHFFNLRTFAKLDAFSHRWPALAQRLRADRSALIALESQVIEPQPLPPGLEGWWEQVRQDESLLAFLKLRPLFLHIDQEVLSRYFEVAEATEAQAPRPAQQTTIASLPAEETVPFYENVFIRLRPEAEEDPESSFVVEIESPLGTAHRKTLVSWSVLLERLNAIPAARTEAALGRNRDPASRRRLLRDVLQEVGEQLFTWLFQGDEVLALVLRLLDEPRHYRINWEMGKPGAMALPLECLFAPPPTRSFLALTRRYSLIRHVPGASSLFQPGFTPPLRVLVLLPAPIDVDPLNMQGEMDLIQRSFGAAGDLVKVQPLKAGEVTLEGFQQALREHRPHLLHFIGHGTVHEEGAGLLIENMDRTARLLMAAELTDLLRDTPIRLAVLNACGTGAALNNDVITSVAGSLVAAGMPAVIGTTQGVEDEAALLFTREFYRSFTAGYSLEAAVVEARKALSVEGWNWSLYALFSGLTDLSSLRLALPSNRGQG